jgi:hypothetical protein
MYKFFLSVIFIFFYNITILNAQDISSKELYIKYLSYPKIVYTQQRFKVNIEAIILTNPDKYNSLITTFEGEKNIIILDDNIVWQKHLNNRYTTQIHFKAQDKQFVLPTIKLSLYNDEDEVKSISLPPVDIIFRKVAIKQERFSKIIADDLMVKNVKVSQYDNKMLMVVANIRAKNSNLEEFHINTIEDQGIKDIQDDGEFQEIFYYMIVPNHLKNINFDYYNPTTESLTNVVLPINLEEDLISTQFDINPHDNDFIFYKKMFYLVLFLIFLLVFVRTKYKLSLLLALIFLVLLGLLMIPNKTINLKPGINVYVLPTKTSTIFRIIKKDTKVEILYQNKNFIKVLFPNKNIGWIKKDVSKS